jgi:hypothetical protein
VGPGTAPAFPAPPGDRGRGHRSAGGGGGQSW